MGGHVRGGCSLNNRYHDPATGTFLTVDPLVASTGQAYLYGAGNPIAFSDPMGLEAKNGATCQDIGGCPYLQRPEEGGPGSGGLAPPNVRESHVDLAENFDPNNVDDLFDILMDANNKCVSVGESCLPVCIGGAVACSKAMEAVHDGDVTMAKYFMSFYCADNPRACGLPFVETLAGALLPAFVYANPTLRGPNLRHGTPAQPGSAAIDPLTKLAGGGGSTVRVVTNLDSAPTLGRSLSVAVGDDALAVAARNGGILYEASLPTALVNELKYQGLAIEKTVSMNGINGKEIRFLPGASEYIIDFFKVAG